MSKFLLLLIFIIENSFGGVFGNIKLTGNVIFEDDIRFKIKTSKESILIPKICVVAIESKKSEIMLDSSCVLDFSKL